MSVWTICIVLYTYAYMYYIYLHNNFIKDLNQNLIANNVIKDLNQNEPILTFIYCLLKSGHGCDRNSLSIAIPNIPLYK